LDQILWNEKWFQSLLYIATNTWLRSVDDKLSLFVCSMADMLSVHTDWGLHKRPRCTFLLDCLLCLFPFIAQAISDCDSDTIRIAINPLSFNYHPQLCNRTRGLHKTNYLPGTCGQAEHIPLKCYDVTVESKKIILKKKSYIIIWFVMQVNWRRYSFTKISHQISSERKRTKESGNGVMSDLISLLSALMQWVKHVFFYFCWENHFENIEPRRYEHLHHVWPETILISTNIVLYQLIRKCVVKCVKTNF
jgi:hypothetical protein